MLIGVSSYPSVLVNELRIIIGQAVDPSSETQVVTSLLDQAQQQGVIETALFDAGYFNQQVIDATEERGIELLCPEGRSQGKDWHKQSGKYYPKSHFQYDLEQACLRPRGYWGLPAFASLSIPGSARSLFNKIHLAPIPRFLEGMGAS
ncbi:hypothetical protein [Thiolapillus sp.]|uniref:hypothetical protein n=1 Tax=Thiolapillus sp. TaxID=2017437 RepID=UPI003AF6527D